MRRSLSVSQNTVTITSPADFIIFFFFWRSLRREAPLVRLVLALRDQARKPCLVLGQKSSKQIFWGGPKHHYVDVSVQICPCSGFGIWALVFKSTQNILICQKIIVSAGASYSYICTSAVRFRTDIEVHSLPDDPLLPTFPSDTATGGRPLRRSSSMFCQPALKSPILALTLCRGG